MAQGVYNFMFSDSFKTIEWDSLVVQSDEKTIQPEEKQ